MLSDRQPLLDLITAVKSKAKTQEHLITLLREYNFVFVDQTFMQDHQVVKLRIRDTEDKYQYMVRKAKASKTPSKEKYDFRLIFAIKILGDKTSKVVVYLNHIFHEYFKIAWEEAKEHNFKKVVTRQVFPEYMDYAERRKWRGEHKKWQRRTNHGQNPEAFEPSEFYLKHKPNIIST